MLDFFKWTGRIEGLSYLFLLFIAMPIKYIGDNPIVVKYAGWAHGVLFMLYIGLAIYAYFEYNWSFKKLFLAGLASITPFGPWIFEKRVLEE